MFNEEAIIKEAKRVFDVEIENLQIIRNSLDKEFVKIVEMCLNCSGKIIMTGMGKSGHISKKISATFASLGTPSFFLHPAEAAHGDLGMVEKQDVVMAFSSSGETEEILNLIPSLKKIGCKIISITCKKKSTLEKYSDLCINIDVIKEACINQLAPTTSTTSVLVYGDALAVTLSKIIEFSKDNFALFHPKGALGKRLLTTVKDIGRLNENNPIIKYNANLKEALFVMTEKQVGAVNIINDKMELVGIITDGDLRRMLKKEIEIFKLQSQDIMTAKPITIKEHALASEAFKIMEDKRISVMPIINDRNICTGIISIHDIMQAGIESR